MLVGWAAVSKTACSEFDSRTAHNLEVYYVVATFTISKRPSLYLQIFVVLPSLNQKEIQNEHANSRANSSYFP